jgi:hypothetical protein
LRLDLNRHCAEYHALGFTVIDVIPEDIALAWGRGIVASISAGNGQRMDTTDSGGEPLYYDLIDGIDCAQAVPSMVDVYRTMPALVSVLTGADVVTSEYPRSKVCGTRYPAGGGRQGWHHDTNGITVVAYLSTNEDGATIAHPLDGSPERRVLPRAGSLLLMQGRRVWHCGDQVNAAEKVISAWNYYVAGDTWRPPGLDDELYGKRRT